MTEYIKREDAIISLTNYLGATSVRASIAANCILNPVPAADVRENVHGEWRDLGDFEQCSVCGTTHLKEFQTYYGNAIWVRTNYCPACGADLRGE